MVFHSGTTFSRGLRVNIQPGKHIPSQLDVLKDIWPDLSISDAHIGTVTRGHSSALGVTIEEVERVLVSNNLKYPFFRIFHNGKRIPREHCVVSSRCGSSTEYDIANLEYIYRSLKDGATVELLDVGRSSRALDEMCEKVSEATKGLAVCHAYFSLGGSRSFGRHSDPHDVVAVQIAGKKAWVFDSVSSDSQASVRNSDRVGDDKTELVTELSAGDVLFVPKGVHHDTRTTGRGSCHISFSIASGESDSNRAKTAAAIEEVRSTTALRARLDPSLFEGTSSLEARKNFDLIKTIFAAPREMPNSRTLSSAKNTSSTLHDILIGY